MRAPLPSGGRGGEGDMAADALDAEIRANLSRNYTAQLVHGMLAMTGFRLVNAPTFVPAYLFVLSGSNLAVGLAMAMQHFGAFGSSLFGAVAVERRAQVLPLGIFYGWMMRFSVLGLALSGFFLEPALSLWAFVVFLVALGVFGGMQSVVFNMLLVKTIPSDRRGFLIGLRFFLGGLTAAAVAWIGGRYLVAPNVLGNGYSTTFLLAFVLTAAGLALLTLVREPIGQHVRVHSTFRQRFKDVPALLRADPNFLTYFAAQALATVATMAMPFYVLSASAKLGLSGALLGDLSFTLLISQTVGHLIWGYAGDRTGFRAVLILALVIWAAGAGLLAVSQSYGAVLAAFLALGAGLAGYQLGTQNMVFAFGGGADLPMRLALINASQSLIQGIGAIFGGAIAAGLFGTLTAYETVLIVAIVVKLAAAAILWFTVAEPRGKRPRRADNKPDPDPDPDTQGA